VEAFHAGLEPFVKKQIQNDFIKIAFSSHRLCYNEYLQQQLPF
jgi:hypothetical protein